MGAVDYLYKPIVPEVLRSKVSVFVDLCRKNTCSRRIATRWSRRTPNCNKQVAERMRAEADVRRLNAELERRVEERTRELRA